MDVITRTCALATRQMVAAVRLCNRSAGTNASGDNDGSVPDDGSGGDGGGDDDAQMRDEDERDGYVGSQVCSGFTLYVLALQRGHSRLVRATKCSSSVSLRPRSSHTNMRQDLPGVRFKVSAV